MLRSVRGDRAFGRLRKGRSGGSPHLSVRLKPTRLGHVRIAVVVSRKVGKAVVRNRVRRRLREALLALLRSGDERVSRWPSSFDLLVIVRPSAAEAGYAELSRGLASALDRAAHERPGTRPGAS
jgi:ribonuclease P protein component